VHVPYAAPLDEPPDGRARRLMREGFDDRLCVVRQGDGVFV
jgi:hypothetical protein